MITCRICGEQCADDAPFCSRGHYLLWQGQKSSTINAQISDTDLLVEPGQEVSCTVTISNYSSRVQEITLEVAGPASHFARVDPRTLQLYTNKSGVARVTFSPARHSNSPAGELPFLVNASSKVDASANATLSGTITVGQFLDLSKSKLSPQTSEGTDTTEHQLTIRNDGNAAVRPTVSGDDPDQVFDFEIAPSALAVNPGERGNIVVRLKPRQSLAPEAGRTRQFYVSIEVSGMPPIRLEGARRQLGPAHVVSVSLKPPQLLVTPGTPASCELLVENQGRMPEEYAVTITGDLAKWANADAPKLSLAAGATGATTIKIQAPRTPEVRAGTTTLIATVTSTAAAAVTAQSAGTVIVDEFNDVRAELKPTAADGLGTAEHKVNIWNLGNYRETVSIVQGASGSRLSIDVSPRELTIEPGAAAATRVSVTVSEGWDARRTQRQPFQILVHSAHAAPLQLQGERTYTRPRGKGFWWKLALVPLAVLAIVGFTAAAISVLGNGGRDGVVDHTPTPSATSTPTPTPVVPPVSVVIADQIDRTRCETSESVTVSVDGKEVGTLQVDDQSIHNDRLAVMAAPGNHKYSLKSKAFFKTGGGQTFTLTSNGTGTVNAKQSASNWQIKVDETQLPVNTCPVAGGAWPLVLKA